MHPAAPPHGRCTVSGVITDRGKFVDDDFLRSNPHGRTFIGAKGTIRMSVYRERRGHWTIIRGTRAYAGLRGRGRESSTGPCPGPIGPTGCSISLTMTGTVSQSPVSAGAGANNAFAGKVRIHLTGTLLGTDQPGAAEGRFTISGAISDRGSFVDKVRPNVRYVRTLSGARGTIEVTFVKGAPNWNITDGTRAYAGLGGQGLERALYTPPASVEITMYGRVWR
jgi:hypothetical protein